MTRFARLDLDSRVGWIELDDDGAWWLDKAPYLGGARDGGRIEASKGRRLAPVVPSKIVCIGRNYAAHARELGNVVPSEPLLFFKPPSALLPPNGTVQLPRVSQRVEHEVELGLVIGQRVKNASDAEAKDAIWAHTIVCDVTARDLQRSDKTWARGKGFDTFCPVGPELVRGLDDSSLAIRCKVNGELRQDGNTDAMIFRPAALVAYISRVMTLEPGDLIATGTPAGVGPLIDGDALTLSIEGISDLNFEVAGV
jgi:2-keto-4-pentenoate hydratase/2-oxohepta-3-ene-1,7-dioic acid hydratase in catechol pathway